LRYGDDIIRFGYDADAVDKRLAEAAGGKKGGKRKKKAKFTPGMPGKAGLPNSDAFGAIVAPRYAEDLANMDLTEIGAIARGRSTQPVSALAGAKDQQRAQAAARARARSHASAMGKWKKECAAVEEAAAAAEEEIRVMQKRYKNMPHLMPPLPDVPRSPPAPVRPATPEKEDRPPDVFFTLGGASARARPKASVSSASDPRATDGSRIRAGRAATARTLLAPSIAGIVAPSGGSVFVGAQGGDLSMRPGDREATFRAKLPPSVATAVAADTAAEAAGGKAGSAAGSKKKGKSKRPRADPLDGELPANLVPSFAARYRGSTAGWTLGAGRGAGSLVGGGSGGGGGGGALAHLRDESRHRFGTDSVVGFGNGSAAID